MNALTDPTTLVETHQHYATRRARWTARHFLHQYGADELPDIEQEGRIGLWQAITTYDPAQSQLTTWIQRCVDYHVRRYMHTIRTQAPHASESLDDPSHHQGELVDPHPSLEQQVLQHDLQVAIAHLSPGQQQIVELRYSDHGCSRRTCARRLGTRPDAMRMEETQALTQLRMHLHYHQ